MSRLVPVLAMLLTLGAPVLAAQRPQARAGFWISGGGGFGSLDLTCSGCTVDREPGVAYLLALGGTVSRSLLLGGEIEGWAKEVNGVDITFGHVSGVAYWYPQSNGGFFIKGGLGVASLALDAGPLSNDSENGLGLHIGAGYDVRLGKNLSLTPAGSFFWGNFEDGQANAVHLGLAVTGH